MNIRRSMPGEITVLEGVYKKAFESNVFPEYMIEDESDGETDLSPEISIRRNDLITLTVYEDGRIVGGAVLDCTGNDKNKLERLFISPEYQSRGLGFAAWQKIEQDYSENRGWILRTPTCLINNICFYVNKCGFHIVRVENVGADGIGMFIFEK